MIEHILKKFDADAVAVKNGRDAYYKLIDNNEYNALITDLRLPQISGEELILKIREYENSFRKPHIPIIVLSGEGDPEERIVCVSKYGANEYLLKPVQLNDLMDALIRIAQKQKARKLHILIVDDDALSPYFIGRVFSDAGHTFTLCKSNEDVFLIVIDIF